MNSEPMFFNDSEIKIIDSIPTQALIEFKGKTFYLEAKKDHKGIYWVGHNPRTDYMCYHTDNAETIEDSRAQLVSLVAQLYYQEHGYETPQ